MSETRGLWAFARGAELSGAERAHLDETLKALGIDRKAYQPFIQGKPLDIHGLSPAAATEEDAAAPAPAAPRFDPA